MATSAFSMLVLVGMLAGQTPPAGAGAFESTIDLTPQCKIDELVFGRLKELNIQPSGVCSDGVFFRRVYLDVVGTLPTGKEAAAFLAAFPQWRTKALDSLAYQAGTMLLVIPPVFVLLGLLDVKTSVYAPEMDFSAKCRRP